MIEFHSKSYVVFPFVLILIVVLISCEDKSDPIPIADLTLSPDLLEVYYPDTVGSFTVINTGEFGSTLAYNIEEQCRWLTVSPASGHTEDIDTITVTVEFSEFSILQSFGEYVIEVNRDHLKWDYDTETILIQAYHYIPVCDIELPSDEFGLVVIGGCTYLTFNIANSGEGTLEGNLSESCPEFGVVGSSTYSLSAGQSQAFTFRYCPADEGNDSCVLDLGSDCGTITLYSSDLPPECWVFPPSLQFCDVDIGDYHEETFTITNEGGGVLTGDVAENCDEFEVVGERSYSLSALQSQTFTVRYSPIDDEVDFCELDPGNECDQITLYGTTSP